MLPKFGTSNLGFFFPHLTMAQYISGAWALLIPCWKHVFIGKEKHLSEYGGCLLYHFI